MLALKVEQYTCELDAALSEGDLERIREVSAGCDQYLRAHLPLPVRHDEDLTRLAVDMEKLLSSYRRAIDVVEQAKQEAGKQLHSLGKTKAHTHQYLDIARNMGA